MILNKVWLFLKAHWKPIVVGIAIVIISLQIRSFLVGRENDLLIRERSLLSRLEDSDKDHNLQIQKIKNAYDEEKKRREANIKLLEEDLKSSKEQYCILVNALEAKKNMNITKIVKEYNEDPLGLAEKVNKVLGFEIVIHEGFKK